MTTTPVQSGSNTLRYLQIIFFAAIILYGGKALFIPLFFGMLIAMILYPVCKWLENRSIPRSIAITICLLIVAFFLAALGILLVWQISLFRQDAPHLIRKTLEVWREVEQWIAGNFGFAAAGFAQDSVGSIAGIIKALVNNLIDMLFTLFLIPVFTALFLYHRRIFVQFVRWAAGEKLRPVFDMILPRVINTYFKYIKGMILVYFIVGVLNSIGLLLMGIEHAVLFGMLCAIMTIIPYVGIVVSALLPISIAWLSTGSLWYPAGVIAVFTVVQYLEANVIFPKVVGVQLNVSTWAMLVAVIAGGILWGISGMVLFIPFVALLKICSDYIEEWKPLSLLLGRDK